MIAFLGWFRVEYGMLSRIPSVSCLPSTTEPPVQRGPPASGEKEAASCSFRFRQISIFVRYSMCELVTTESSFVTCLQRVRKGVRSSASTRSDQVSTVQASYKVSIYGYIIFWTKKTSSFDFPHKSYQINQIMVVCMCLSVISPSVPVKAMSLTQNNGKIFF